LVLLTKLWEPQARPSYARRAVGRILRFLLELGAGFSYAGR